MHNTQKGMVCMAFSEKQMAYKYINQYQKQKYDRITILRRSGEKKELEKIALEKGYKSLGNFINSCIDEKLKRYGIQELTPDQEE